MKTRDYVFWTVLTLSSVALSTWLRHPAESPFPPQHSAAPAHRSASFIDRATYWYAVWRLAHGAPQAPATSQELPDEVVNAPAVRVEGPDGNPLLAHGAGW